MPFCKIYFKKTSYISLYDLNQIYNALNIKIHNLISKITRMC